MGKCMKNWKKAKKWLIAVAAVVVIVLAGVTAWRILRIRKSEIPETVCSERPAALGVIDLTEGKLKVAESETKELYINTKNMNLYVKDKEKNVTWNAILESANKGTELSLLTISYLGEDNSITEWDSYTYCVEKESFQLEQLENGVRILMNFNAGEASNFYEYMPSKISEERYQTVFLDGLQAKVDSGEITEDQCSRYLNTLGLVYARSKSEAAYTVNYVGQPPGSAVTQLIQVAKLVGYTTEMLLEDAETYGFTVEFAEPAEFNLVLEATLDNDELVVNVPGSSIESVNDYYVVQNIKLLPNFSVVQAKDITEGWMLIPDGSGALMKMNTYQSKIPEYNRAMYASDFFKEYYYISEYGSDLMMPLFGMMLDEGTKDASAFLAIIESGADNAYITARLASADAADVGVVYNKVFASFDTIQYDNVKVFGEYSDNAASYMVKTDFIDMDYSIRYLLYPEQTGYYKMAKDYQSYLLREESGRELVYQTKAELYLNILGTVTLSDRILGIPYDYEDSLTDYKQAIEIIESLGERNIVLNYDGAFSGGLENELLMNAELTKTNGSKSDWEKLKNLMEERGEKLYLSAPFLHIYSSGNGYMTKLHALSDFSSDPVEIFGYHLALGTFGMSNASSNFHLLKPAYLSYVVDKFLDTEKEAYNLNLTDLANQYYADYKNNNVVLPNQAQEIISDAISKLSENRGLALTDPRADRFTAAELAVDISRNSCGYSTFAFDIPFRQLVLNGLCKYTTTDVNNNSKGSAYFLLQALETGSMLKYTVMASDADVLKNSHYSYYYDVNFGTMEHEIKAMYDEYQQAMQLIGSSEIVNHTILQDNVYLTEYVSGTKIITNYNMKAVTVDEEIIEGLSYKILQEGE